ncbi:PEP-CTERM sorting domain-containing protein [bacterium]|nr:PEP-CTERM sorting domain-containing protein [bacterium]
MIHFVLAISVVLSSSAYCSSDNWQWQFMNRAYFGTNINASDGFDSLDIMYDQSQQYHIAVYHEYDLDGWSGSTGYYSYDIRSPLEQSVGASKTWIIYLWGSTSIPEEAWYLSLPWTFSGDISQASFDTISFSLTYVRPAIGVTGEWTPPLGYSPPVGTTISLNDYTEGNWLFPIYRTEQGLDGYIFSLTATVIPEPSGFFALLGSLACMGGIAWRRRR